MGAIKKLEEAFRSAIRTALATTFFWLEQRISVASPPSNVAEMLEGWRARSCEQEKRPIANTKSAADMLFVHVVNKSKDESVVQS